MKTKLAIVSTHPIQYFSPWFRFLAEGRKEYGISDMGYGKLEAKKDEEKTISDIQYPISHPAGGIEGLFVYVNVRVNGG